MTISILPDEYAQHGLSLIPRLRGAALGKLFPVTTDASVYCTVPPHHLQMAYMRWTSRRTPAPTRAVGASRMHKRSGRDERCGDERTMWRMISAILVARPARPHFWYPSAQPNSVAATAESRPAHRETTRGATRLVYAPHPRFLRVGGAGTCNLCCFDKLRFLVMR